MAAPSIRCTNMRYNKGRFIVITVMALVVMVYLYASGSKHGETINQKEAVDARLSNITCLQTKTDPLFTICIHDLKKDIYVSKFIATKGSWETGILKDMSALLKRDETLGLIDVGANIGYYSLYAAALGRDVVAIEPLEDNIVRLKKSIQLNKFNDRVTLLENAVSDRRGVGLILKHPYNQGDTRVRMEGAACLGNCKEHITSNMQVTSILLDDLVSKMRTRRAIMKIDIEGAEHVAFRKASALLDNVFIPIIFMEWNLLTAQKLKSAEGINISKEEKLIEDMISLLLSKNYRPYRNVSQKITLDIKRWRNWPPDIVWKYEI